ncbi:RAMP superfamily CRISPR-associated protein [Gallibacterium anatis]|uniref:RAMP superfamily CRISPR-associated protein n=1 Tax=Gallibacterium anatis TaxID=750 RepID=UPI0039FD3134
MTKEFMQTYQIYLTPLSPIHIGCGEDFEPTNYVIDKNVLYHFDPSNLCLLKEKRDELLNLAKQDDLLKIQKFFKKNVASAKSFSHYLANVANGVADSWEKKIGNVAQYEGSGKGIKEVISALAIERTSYLPYENNAYIPGSSFKGTLVTAFLDLEHKKDGNPRLENKVNLIKKYNGEFKESEFRTVKFGDFIPQKEISSKIYFCINLKKKPNEKGILGKGISLKREAILAGQYRAFQSNLSLWENKYKQKMPYQINRIFDILNKYYVPIFEEECENLISNKVIDRQWVARIRALLNENKTALIRLGKNGADSKILRSKNTAQIKIMLGKGESTKKDRSSTLWLAGNNERQSNDLLPFGWALLEIKDGQENAKLKQWCEQQFDANGVIDKQTLIRQHREEQEQLRKDYEEEIKKIQLTEQQRLAMEREKAELLNSASDNQRLVLEFLDKLENTREKQIDTSGSPLLKEAQSLLSAAVEWSQEEQAFIKEKITFSLLKTKIDFKKKDAERNFKKLVNKLVGTN